MPKPEFAILSFPPYEWIKALPKTKLTHYRERDTGKIKSSTLPQEYEFTLFRTPVSVYGRLSYNEDGDGFINFDVMESGYCGENSLGKCLKFNKVNYRKICDYAQKVYEYFQQTLLEDTSYSWSGKTPEQFAEEN